MVFASALANDSKLERALVVAFALAEVLVQGGERVGIPGPDAADREPQRHREDGAKRSCTTPPSARACRRLSRPRRCPRSWCCPTCGARSPKCRRRSRSSPPPARTATSCRSSIRPRRPSPIPAASSSSSRKAPARITAGRAETWRNDYQALRRAPPRRDPRRDRPARLELRHPPHRPAGERTAAGAACAHGRQRATAQRRQPPRAGATREGGMIAGLPLAFAQPLVLLGPARACRCCGGCCGWCRRARAASTSRRRACCSRSRPRKRRRRARPGGSRCCG